MTDRRDTPSVAPVEPPESLLRVQAVSADAGLRILVTLPAGESLLEATTARALARDLAAALNLIGAAD
jgi:hypothetical protein